MTFADLSPDRYRRLTAKRTARLVADGVVSPVHLAEHALASAKAAEPRINAYVRFLEDDALRAAGDREAEARAGRLRGKLHGVPIAVKDNFYLAGYPVSRGSCTASDAPVTENAPTIERVLAAGAVIVGKTTMPEFGWKGTGSSPLTGITRNPWDLSRNPGGSSSGSAATVAAGAVPVALGSDAGGSIRIPAAFCGVAGIKPTLGRIPVWPGTVTESLSHVGPLARSVEDAALVVSATAGPHPRDPLSYGASEAAPGEARARFRAGGLRVAVAAEPFGVAPDDGVAAVFEDAVGRLRESIPAVWADTELDIPLPRSIFEILWVTGRGFGFSDVIAARGAEMDPGLVRCGALAESYSLADFLAAMDDRRRLNARLATTLETWDVLVMPTMPLTAFAAEDEVPPGGEADALLPWVTWTPYTYPFNLSGQPAVSIPCGFDANRLPVGLQIVAKWGADSLALTVARRFEKILGRARPAPVNAP